MSNLAFIMKWDQSIHGSDDNEIHLIDYFKTKYLVLELVWGEGENSFDYDMTLQDNIEWLHKYHDDPSIPNEHLKLVPIKNMYRYHDRDFAVINFGLEKFQLHFKKYYKQKMKYLRSAQNLNYRQVHGKYPKFKFKLN